MPSGTFKEDLIGEIPPLRAFAMSLCGNSDRADDLVQETLIKAWSASKSFQPGTNIRAWTFTILRNTYFSELRSRKREVEDVDGVHSARVAVPSGQIGHLDFQDFLAVLNTLPPDHREVLTLIGASGFSYEEAADICGVPVGTIKSRLNRARLKLAQMLDISSLDDIGPDGIDRATTIGASASTVE